MFPRQLLGRFFLQLIVVGSFASCANAPVQPSAPAAPTVPAPAPAPLIKPADGGKDRVKSFRALPGFLALYWDQKKGELWLEITRFDTDFLYVTSLPGGLGSNDVGLDRNKLGEERVVRFVRSGPRFLFIKRTRASGPNTVDAADRRAV